MPQERKIDQFVRLYEAQLIATYPWAANNATKRHEFVRTVRDTLTGAESKWIPDSPLLVTVLTAMGITIETRTLMQLREILKDGTHT